VKFLPLFAEGEASAPAPGATGQPDPAGGAAPQQGGLFGGGIMSFAPIILLALFFLVVMLPAQRRRKREEAERLAKMKPGAKVFLNSGIVGKIVTIKDGEDEIVIKSDDTKLRVLRSAVATVVDETAPATTEPAKS
jgi:preprotein translocase subunit YajC